MTARRGDVDEGVRRADPIDMERLAAAWFQSRAGRDLLVDIVGGSTAHPAASDAAPPRRPRRRRRMFAALATAVVAALLLAGWTAYQEAITLPAPSERSDRFQRSLPDHTIACRLPDGTTAYTSEWVEGLDETPVDPARTCADEWRFQGADPPEMRAYQNTSGEIVVVPSDRDVPAAWRPYVYEPVAPAVLELQTSLVDYVDGLQSDCFDVAGARMFAERELRRLGLAGWRVTVREAPADAAAEGCAGARLLSGDRRIEILPGLDAGADDDPAAPLADRVRTLLAERCLAPDQAAASVRELVRVTGLDDWEWGVRTIADDDAECTRADINVYTPQVNIDLRGPTGGGPAVDDGH